MARKKTARRVHPRLCTAYDREYEASCAQAEECFRGSTLEQLQEARAEMEGVNPGYLTIRARGWHFGQRDTLDHLIESMILGQAGAG